MINRMMFLLICYLLSVAHTNVAANGDTLTTATVLADFSVHAPHQKQHRSAVFLSNNYRSNSENVVPADVLIKANSYLQDFQPSGRPEDIGSHEWEMGLAHFPLSIALSFADANSSESLRGASGIALSDIMPLSVRYEAVIFLAKSPDQQELAEVASQLRERIEPDHDKLNDFDNLMVAMSATLSLRDIPKAAQMFVLRELRGADEDMRRIWMNKLAHRQVVTENTAELMKKAAEQHPEYAKSVTARLASARAKPNNSDLVRIFRDEKYPALARANALVGLAHDEQAIGMEEALRFYETIDDPEAQERVIEFLSKRTRGKKGAITPETRGRLERSALTDDLRTNAKQLRRE